MCLMIDYPKYKILDTEVRGQRSGLKEAWEKLKKLVVSITPYKDYKCDRCELQPYCKWCPGKGWLYQKNFTSCEPESYRKAELTRQLLNC